MTTSLYTTQLQAGLGMVEETKTLLSIWQDGWDTTTLFEASLKSGLFPKVSARRLRNIVAECFAPRYLVEQAHPARFLRSVNQFLNPREFVQFLFIYTCRANTILADFVKEVYWPAYGSGREFLSRMDSRRFVDAANVDGKMSKLWSESTLRRVSAYLAGCCSDFGLLGSAPNGERRILPYRIEPKVTSLLAHELRAKGNSDHAILHHPDWGLFGLTATDVVSELKQVALMGHLVLQTSGEVTHVGWKFDNVEDLAYVLSKKQS